MGLIKWVRQPFDRIESNIRVLFKGDEDDLLEEDPIGEFLYLKATGAIQFENENCPDEIEDNAGSHEPASDSVHAEVSKPSVVNLLQDPEEQEPGEEDLAGTAPEDDEELSGRIKYEADSVDTADDDNKQALDVSDADVEAAEATASELQDQDGESLKSDDVVGTVGDPQTAEAASEKNAGDDQSRTQKPQEDEGVGSLLDVFRDEQLTENPISILARDLEDTSVHSLLEETKQIADSFKKSSGDNR